MTEWTWINGEVMPLSEVRIGPEDRGFQFADGVYEVVRVYAGVPFTLDAHLARLEHSSEGIRLSLPFDRQALADAIRKVIARNALREGMVYLQATRGVAPRNHVFPEKPIPTVLCYARPLPPVPPPGQAPGVKLITLPDERWQRCWIKSIALLPNVLAKTQAIEVGADEAVFVDQGIITECSASNLFAVVGGTLVTHPVGPKVLPGITRAVLLECVRDLGIPVQERPLRLDEATAAEELFITSTTREISWVAMWNGKQARSGRCGPITLRLHRALQERVRRETGV